MDNPSGKKHTSSLVVLISLFFMWGFITCLNDILIPYLKGVFNLMHWQAMLVQFAFFEKLHFIFNRNFNFVKRKHDGQK